MTMSGYRVLVAAVLSVRVLSATGPAVTFTDATAAAKITFKHSNGAFGRKYHRLCNNR